MTATNDELERRLRALLYPRGSDRLAVCVDVLREAARIGAEIEREACAMVPMDWAPGSAAILDAFGGSYILRDACSAAIRARGKEPGA